MAYDSSVTPTDVREEIGLDDDATEPPTATLEKKIASAEAVVEYESEGTDASAALKARAVTVLAGANALGLGTDPATTAVGQGSASVEFDDSLLGQQRAERLAAEGERLLSVIRGDSSGQTYGDRIETVTAGST
jgi:hypothetical protein